MKRFKSLVILAIVIGAVAVPIWIQCLKRHREFACSQNLRQIHAAVWAVSQAEKYPLGTVIPTPILTKCMKGDRLPVCPSGGRYIIPPFGETPTCSYHGNLLSKYATALEACNNNLRIIAVGKREIEDRLRGQTGQQK